MSERTQVAIKGNERLMRFLNELPLFIQRTGEQLSSDAADIATAEAKRLVPVRTGRLQRSIRKSHTQKGEYRVGSSVPYAGFVEMGTRKMVAQPYLRPAAEVANQHLAAKAAELLKRQASEDYEVPW